MRTHAALPVVRCFPLMAQYAETLRHLFFGRVTQMSEVPYCDSHQQPDELKRLEVPTSKPKAKFHWPPDCLWPFTDHKESDT
jgi:hypothetical protein